MFFRLSLYGKVLFNPFISGTTVKYDFYTQCQGIYIPMYIHLGMYEHYQDFYIIFPYPQIEEKQWINLTLLSLAVG